jgi:hypothetical protein
MKLHTAVDCGCAVAISLIGFLALATPVTVLQHLHLPDAAVAISSVLPKFASDASVAKQVGYGADHRYLFSYMLSSIAFLIFAAWLFVSKPTEIYQPQKGLHFLKRSNLYIMPVVFVLMVYLIFFDVWTATSDARASRMLFHSLMCVFWPPLLFSASSAGIVRSAQVYNYYRL